MKQFEFRLDISSLKYVDYYRGAIKQVVVQCTDGVTIQFPASLLTQFVTTAGVHGHFILTCNENNKRSELLRK